MHTEPFNVGFISLACDCMACSVKIATWPSSSRSIKREKLKETEVSKRAIKENAANS